ncbi:2-hydroxy-3-oxopropionate reductase [Virgibacillus sp. NKC19-16]|uniref:2-hydroxy-3-oxopropionate reductase n=1 Tax=Virgibacillus salidurans TaxID=2831673 RepID=UPI001F197C5B|nr:2-hydroxy-3-oxopropionate reductase [Virgibacillus sp. NKC19-16]UJL47425.1 2-hydroxy-3-oxopropionate reductase [Virgibacillus sp. NKC19-16]
MKVGFVGLGIMGKPMAGHIIKDGFETYLFDINTNAVNELVELGGHACESNKEVAENSDIIITMLPTAKHVSQVLSADDGLAENGKAGSVIIDMSSVSTEESKAFASELKEYDIHFIDAPVSGGEPMAIEGKLSIMVGGDEAQFNKVLPIFQAMGENIVHFGEAGTGSAAKIANQIIVSTNLAALSEACVYASKSGIDLNKLFEAIHGGLAGSAVMDAKMPRIIDRDFEPGGRIETNYKDLGNIQSSANAIGVPLPVTNLVKEIFSSEIANGNGKKDHSYIINFFERMGNFQTPKGGKS